MKRFLRKVQGDFRSFHGELGLLEGMDGVSDLQSNVLSRAALLVLIAATAYGGIREVGFRAVVFQRKIQGKRGAVGRVGEMKYLGQTGAQPSVAGRRAIPSHAVARIKTGEFEIGLQAVVRQTNAQFVTGELLAGGFQLWAVGQSASESRTDVRGRQFAERLGL